jgi:DNA-directed RNA polymerase specialized sigma24 family protein
MTKRELLENYRLLVLEINTLERQSDFLNQFIGGPRPVRAVRLTGMPRGTNDPEAAMLQRADYDDAIYKIEQKSEELRELVSEFEHIMEMIPDKEDALILRDYYALGWTDIKIGRALGYDKSTIWKRRSKALHALDD